MTACPDDHVEYASRMLADNAATLHRLLGTTCTTFNAFPCGDHWHVGHADWRDGKACRATGATGRPVRS